jgi:pimeloyl-ACP methyl ester carboxylesterase
MGAAEGRAQRNDDRSKMKFEAERQKPRQQRAARSSAAKPGAGQTAQVNPGWLLGALALLGVAAACFAYLSLCLLFIQGQWQLLYHPSAKVAATPSSRGLAYTAVPFGTNEAGAAELSGWWLPASPDSALAATTVLYLHDGAGSLSDTLPDLARIHALGCALFAMDYRGYGASAPGKPGEAGMVEDTQRAIAYLFDTRHIPPGSLVLWGRGIGATLAAEASPGTPLILEDPNPPAMTILGSDPRTRLLPVRLMLRDSLDPAQALARSSAPKLFVGSSARTRQLYALAASPKQLAPDVPDTAEIGAFLANARSTRP